MFIKLIVGTSVMDGKFLRMKLQFVSVRLLSLKSDIYLKLKKGSDESGIKLKSFWGYGNFGYKGINSWY